MGDENKGEMCRDLVVGSCLRIRPIQRISGEGQEREVLIGPYRAGGATIMIPYAKSAFANSSHGTSLSGMDYFAND